jgi:diguanylate cyclase (GGDEF)-like protein
LATAGCAVFLFLLFLKNYLSAYLSPLLGGWAAFLLITFYRYFFTFLENVGLRQKVITDPLTGLYNRRILEFKIDEELARMIGGKAASKTNLPDELSVLMIDIDDFKKINDTYGHQFGDDALKNVTFSIQERIHPPQFASRFGGEEFCVVLPGAGKEEARQIAERIRESVACRKLSYVSQIAGIGSEAALTVSVGVASSQEDGLSSSRALVRAADRALYHAKQTGKNKVCLYDPTD